MSKIIFYLVIALCLVLASSTEPKLATPVENVWLDFPVSFDDPTTPADERLFVNSCNCRVVSDGTGDLICTMLGIFDMSYQASSNRGLARIHSDVDNGYVPEMKMVVAFDFGTGFVEKNQVVPGSTTDAILLVNGVTLHGETSPTWAALRVNYQGYNDYTVLSRFSPEGVLASVAIDDEGYIYISDTLQKKIYRIDEDGSNKIVWVDSQPLLGDYGNIAADGMGVNGIKFNSKRKGLEIVDFNIGLSGFIPKLLDRSAGEIYTQYVDASNFGFVETALDSSEKYKFSGRFLNAGEIARIHVRNDNKPSEVDWIIIPNSGIIENTHVIPTTGMKDPVLEGCLLAMSLGLAGPGKISTVCPDLTDPYSSTSFY